jgi:glycine/D-amino acid oxidase-like deaminating enzyme
MNNGAVNSPGNGSAPHRLGAMQTLDFPLEKYSGNEEVDYLIVGVGSAGGELLQRLARAGFRVVGMEAGPILGDGTRLLSPAGYAGGAGFRRFRVAIRLSSGRGRLSRLQQRVQEVEDRVP